MVLIGSGSKGFRMRDSLSLTLAALANPTRRAILSRLALGDASVAELASPFDTSVRAISKHIAVLEGAGLVTRGRDAQRRPSRLRLKPLKEVDRWLTTYRQLWEGRFNRMEGVLEQIRKGKIRDPRS
jgi:DNA-binding transcriptional ArsR family regulator